MGRIKLIIKSGKASMSPPIGPILGQCGIPGAKFCQEFNKETEGKYKKDVNLRVVLNQSQDKSFSRIVMSPHHGYILKRLIVKNSIDIRRIYQLALILLTEDNSNNIKNKCKTIISIAQSMKLTIKK